MKSSKLNFTHEPESHACKGVDEWLSVQDSAPRRNPVKEEATAVKPWSFTKLVASGNDFILLDLRSQKSRLNLKVAAKQLCNRRLGIGADGLLVLERSRRANVKMRIFNADGSEAEMCGNGARCVVFFLKKKKSNIKGQIRIDTKAGILKAKVNRDSVKINMTDPESIKLDSVIKLSKHPLRVNFINTGVPHTVILCEGIEKIGVNALGRLIRYHKRFKPKGTNVNFIEPQGLDSIKIRTYERGVEEETLACGTGAVAAAIIYVLKLRKSGLLRKNKLKVNVDTISGETLKVFFEIVRNKIKDVWLEGKVRVICQGQMTPPLAFLPREMRSISGTKSLKSLRDF